MSKRPDSASSEKTETGVESKAAARQSGLFAKFARKGDPDDGPDDLDEKKKIDEPALGKIGRAYV